MEIEPEWGTMTLPESEPSPLAATPGTETEFQYPHNDTSNSENPLNQQDSEIPRSSTTTTTTSAEDEDLYRDLENLENVSDLIRQNSEGDDNDNPFYSGKKLLPLITGNDDDTEIDGPDQLPVLDDPLSATLQVGSTENLEETVPLARRDRSRSEAGERDAELAGLAFAKHLALQIVSDNSNITTHHNYHGSGLVREDSLENGLTLVPATPPPTPLSRTSSSSSNISILNPTLSLHTVSEEGHGTDEELGNGEDGEDGEGGEESTNGSVRSLVSGGSLVINPPTTPMAASTRSNIPYHQLQQQQQPQHQPQISILPPSSSAYIVPMTPPTTPQNRTSGATTTSSTIMYQKQSAGFYKPVKPELKQRSGKGASLLSSSSNQGGSGMPPPTPPVTPMNRTGFGHGGRPPPIVANHIGDPAPTPPPTPMSGATNTPIASSLSIRVSTETAPDYMIPEMSPVVGASRSRSSSDITGSSSGGGGLGEIKGHLSNSLLASKFASLSIQTPTSGTGGDDVLTPRSGNAVIIACRVFDCNGRAFLRGYCAKHWRLAKRTPQEMLDSQDADTEQDGDEGEDSKSDLKVDSEPNTPASYEYTLPWLVNSEDGESHWQDWKENLIPASSSGGGGTVVYGSQEFQATNVTIQEYLPQTKTNFECSPVSQLITILAGTFSIRASDGKSKTVTPGNMVLLQDNSGKGHQITVIGSGKHLLSRTLLQATNPSSTATTQ